MDTEVEADAISDVKGAVPYTAAPIIEEAWDGDAAKGRLQKWAAKADGKIDPAKYRKGFAWVDESDPTLLGSYKLPHHDIKDGKLVTNLKGVHAAAAAVQGARGGVDIPDSDMPDVKSHLGKHYKQAGDTPPWEGDKSADISTAIIEYKRVPFEIKQADESGEFTGVAGAFLNVDSGGDIIMPGAFRKDLATFLASGFVGGLNHDWDDPIGRPVAVTEGSDGLMIKARISDTTHGRDCRILLKDGVIKSLSIGYQALGSRMVNDPVELKTLWDSHNYIPSDIDKERSKAGVRLLTRLKIFEVSPVTVPMNERAVITGAKRHPAIGSKFDAETATAESTVRTFVDRARARHQARAKEGRTFSESNRKRLTSLSVSLRSALADIDELLSSTEPKLPSVWTLEPAKAAAPQSTVSYDDDFARYIETRGKLLHLGLSNLGLQ